MVPSRVPSALAAFALLGSIAGAAHADDRAAAAEAYDRGTRAFEAGRFREAAESFWTADRLAPSPTALESALESAARSDDAGLVLEIVEVAEARGGEASFVASVREARARFAPRAGKLQLQCGAPGENATCALRIGGDAWPAGVARWIEAGDHVVVVDRGRGEERFPATVPAGEALVWRPPAPAAPVGPVPRPEAQPPAPMDTGATSSGGPSPAWFFVGLGATTLLGAGAVGTGLATLGAHDEFAAEPTEQGRSDGLLLQNVTNGLIVGAAAAGITTLVLAFVVDWSGGEPASPSSAGGPPVLARF